MNSIIGIHWSNSTFIIEIFILEENIEIYIGDALITSLAQTHDKQ